MTQQNHNENKLTISFFVIVGLQLSAGIIGTILSILALKILTPTMGMITLVVNLGFILSCILMLLKIPIGVLLYVCAFITNITISILNYSGNISLVVGTFILPLLMSSVLYKNRDCFKLK